MEHAAVDRRDARQHRFGPLFYHFLGPGMHALWFYVLTFTGAFGFMDLGLGVAVGRYVGVALGREDRQAVREYWGTGNAIAIPLLAAMGLIFCDHWRIWTPKWFNVDPSLVSLLRWSFIAGGAGLFLSYYGQFWLILSQAHLDFQVPFHSPDCHKPLTNSASDRSRVVDQKSVHSNFVEHCYRSNPIEHFCLAREEILSARLRLHSRRLAPGAGDGGVHRKDFLRPSSSVLCSVQPIVCYSESSGHPLTSLATRLAKLTPERGLRVKCRRDGPVFIIRAEPLAVDTASHLVQFTNEIFDFTFP